MSSPTHDQSGPTDAPLDTNGCPCPAGIAANQLARRLKSFSHPLRAIYVGLPKFAIMLLHYVAVYITFALAKDGNFDMTSEYAENVKHFVLVYVSHTPNTVGSGHYCGSRLFDPTGGIPYGEGIGLRREHFDIIKKCLADGKLLVEAFISGCFAKCICDAGSRDSALDWWLLKSYALSIGLIGYDLPFNIGNQTPAFRFTLGRLVQSDRRIRKTALEDLPQNLLAVVLYQVHETSFKELARLSPLFWRGGELRGILHSRIDADTALLLAEFVPEQTSYQKRKHLTVRFHPYAPGTTPRPQQQQSDS